MAEERIRRRLAAILAADMAGYSRLIETDERGTIARQKAHRAELIDPTITEYNGRIVKTMGDGMLVEFGSAVEAVLCAVEVQRAMAKREMDVPKDRRITYRVGINLGDIVIDGDDILGDGVNIAARLEALAEPGGICVSRNVFDQVKNKLELDFEDLREQPLKNISEPVRIYKILLDSDGAAGLTYDVATAALELPDKPSIAVLAFENMSGDREQEYFSDGIAEDIITDLSQLSGLFVIARNSSFAFKGTSADVRQISHELGVRYVLEGSVRKAGNQVRVTAQMIDGATGGHLWAERYDRDLTDIFSVQDEVRKRIVEALKIKLTVDEQSQFGRRKEIDPEAYDCLIRGRECLYLFTREALIEGRRRLRRAIELEPRFAPAHGLLSVILTTEFVNGWNNACAEQLSRAVDLAREGIALDRGDPTSHQALALGQMYRRQFEEAESAAARSIELAPNSAYGHGTLGRVRDYAGSPEDAIDHFRTALRLEPQAPDIYLQFLGHALFSLGRYEEAEGTFKRRLIRNPQSDVSRIFLASIYGHTGRLGEARATWREARKINPEYSLERMRAVVPYKDPSRFELLVQGLNKAGLPE